MHCFEYYTAKILSKLFHNHEMLINYYRSRGTKIGTGCLICTDLSSNDSVLLDIGNDVVISTDVKFVLHDFSISRCIKGKSNLFGKIKIGNNSFIGSGSVLLYGVELGNNVIVAAGSVVTKSFREENIILGGNPAHVIGSWDAFRKKYEANATNVGEFIEDAIKNPDMLVKR